MHDEVSWPTGPPGSRFAAVSRRAFLRRTAATAGAVAAGGLLAACGSSDDAAVLGASSTTSRSSTTTGASTTTTTGTTKGTSTTAAAPGTTPGAATSGSTGALPSGAELVVAFTYAAAAGTGRIDNPYIAVWIEDDTGQLVDALAVWYKQGKDAKYLSELRRWSSTDGADAELAAVTGATRTPGAYSLVWDGTTVDGAGAALATCYVCIEAAREHGPYSLIRQAVPLAQAASTTALSANGELSNATATYHLA